MRRPGESLGQLCKAEEGKVDFWGCLFLASAVFDSIRSFRILSSSCRIVIYG
jgi:hypothetical protein